MKMPQQWRMMLLNLANLVWYQLSTRHLIMLAILRKIFLEYNKQPKVMQVQQTMVSLLFTQHTLQEGEMLKSTDPPMITQATFLILKIRISGKHMLIPEQAYNLLMVIIQANG